MQASELVSACCRDSSRLEVEMFRNPLIYLVWYLLLCIEEKGSGDICRVMLCSVATILLHCNYVGAICIPTQKDDKYICVVDP